MSCVHRFIKTRRPVTIVALVPLSFIMGYQLDMAFGNKMERITGECLWNEIILM